MKLYRFIFHPPQNHKKSALRVARAAIAATTFVLGMLGSATAGAPAPVTTTITKGTLTFSPASGSLGSVGLESSKSILVTITNTGTASATISAGSVTGAEFSVVTGLTIPKTLAVGASMTVVLKFAPTVAGAATGSLNITSNATNSEAKCLLSGTGVTPELTATPSAVSFGSVPEGTTSSQTIQLKNTSTKSVTITGTSISPASQYHESGMTLPLTLAPGAITHLLLALTPNIIGALNGTLTVNVASPNVPLVIKTSGSGIAATRSITATPTSLNFGSETVGKSHLLTVSLKNTGNSGVTVSGITASNTDFTTSGGVSGATLAAGQSATLGVTFDPKTATAQSGTVKISSNADNSPLTIVVTGTGISGTVHSVALTWGASTSSGIVGYYLYRSTTAGSGFARLAASPLTGLQYTDGSVQSGTTYYYKVTAVNSAGLESPSTPEATAVIP